MSQIIEDLINNLVFIFERLDWLAVFDLLLVTMIFYLILRWLRDTQALVLLRGVFLLIALIGLLTSLEVLPAFSWDAHHAAGLAAGYPGDLRPGDPPGVGKARPGWSYPGE